MSSIHKYKYVLSVKYVLKHKYKYVLSVKYVFKNSDMFGYVTVPLVSAPSRRYI